MSNTLLSLSQQYDLVDQGLAKVKYDFNLATFKYAKKVMYDYMWKTNPNLLECRGHVYDTLTSELVQAAPRKSFNYLEDGHWKDTPLSTPVHYMKKYNGFMACATMHNGELVVSTTKSTSSQYAQWARKEIQKLHSAMFHSVHITSLYEIIHNEDLHIVDEGAQKAIYLGSRWKDDGQYVPAMIHVATLGEVLKLAEADRGEGFMVWKEGQYEDCCKIKTPYYIGKKKLMRMNQGKTEQMYNPSNYKVVVDSLPEMWKDIVFDIQNQFTKEQWINTSEQDRRKFLETIV